MLDVNFATNKIEIVRPEGDTSDIIVSSDFVSIGSLMRFSYDDEIEIVIRERATSKTEKSKAQSNLLEVKSKNTEVNEETFGTRKKGEDYSNADYVIMAIREFGRPVKSVSDIRPILAENGYYSEAKNTNSAIRYYLSQDKRTVKTPRGYELVEWQDAPTIQQTDLYAQPEEPLQ